MPAMILAACRHPAVAIRLEGRNMHALLALYVLPASLALLGVWLDRIAAHGLLDPLAGAAARQVIQSLREHPQYWHQLDQFTLDFSIEPLEYSHKAPLRIWICNGRLYVRLEGKIKQSFNPFGKLCVWHACQHWQAQHGALLEEVLGGRRQL